MHNIPGQKAVHKDPIANDETTVVEVFTGKVSDMFAMKTEENGSPMPPKQIPGQVYLFTASIITMIHL